MTGGKAIKRRCLLTALVLALFQGHTADAQEMVVDIVYSTPNSSAEKTVISAMDNGDFANLMIFYRGENVGLAPGSIEVQKSDLLESGIVVGTPEFVERPIYDLKFIEKNGVISVSATIPQLEIHDTNLLAIKGTYEQQLRSLSNSKEVIKVTLPISPISQLAHGITTRSSESELSRIAVTHLSAQPSSGQVFGLQKLLTMPRPKGATDKDPFDKLPSVYKRDIDVSWFEKFSRLGDFFMPSPRVQVNISSKPDKAEIYIYGRKQKAKTDYQILIGQEATEYVVLRKSGFYDCPLQQKNLRRIGAGLGQFSFHCIFRANVR